MKKQTVLAAALSLALSSTAALAATVYDNLPSPQPGNVVSLGYESTSTSEFGGLVGLAGTQRQNPQVTVLMSSWGCQSGGMYTYDCMSATGAMAPVDITLKLYNVNNDGSVGTQLAAQTKTFQIPYRPSADPVHCTNPGTDANGGNDAGKWYNAADNTCYSGLATPITFDPVAGLTLPSQVIVSVSYNTSHYGSNPMGENTACYTGPGGCIYDSLNVGVWGGPSVGTTPLAGDAYWNTAYGPFYCEGGVGGTFRLDAGGCWTGMQPAFQIAALSIPTSVNACMKNGWMGVTRADGSAFKNQGDCVSYVSNGK